MDICVMFMVITSVVVGLKNELMNVAVWVEVLVLLSVIRMRWCALASFMTVGLVGFRASFVPFVVDGVI